MQKGGFKKRVLKLKPHQKAPGKFWIRKAGDTGQPVFVDLGKTAKYQVVGLSRVGLPLWYKGTRKIKWINNFGIKDRSGKYVQKVTYALYLRNRPGKTFVYFDGKRIRDDKKPRPQHDKWAPRGWVKVTLTVGDPAEGWS